MNVGEYVVNGGAAGRGDSRAGRAGERVRFYGEGLDGDQFRDRRGTGDFLPVQREGPGDGGGLVWRYHIRAYARANGVQAV